MSFWHTSNEKVFLFQKKEKNSIFCRYTVFPFVASERKQKRTTACFQVVFIYKILYNLSKKDHG